MANAQCFLLSPVTTVLISITDTGHGCCESC